MTAPKLTEAEAAKQVTEAAKRMHEARVSLHTFTPNYAAYEVEAAVYRAERVRVHDLTEAALAGSGEALAALTALVVQS